MTLSASDPLVAGLGARLKRLGEARLPLLSQRRLRQLGDANAAQAAMRALATALPLPQPSGETLVLCRVLGRHKLLVAAADLGHAPHLVLDGYWKWWVTAFLARNLAPGQRFVDAGAAYGYFALLAGDLVGPTGRVLAVEANPLLAGLLRRNLELNNMADRSEVRYGALGAAEAAGIGRLSAPPDSPTAARLLPEGAAEPKAAVVMQSPAAPALDALLPDGADWVKLDLNGAEPAAWDGMQGLLERCPALGLIVAFDPARLADAAGWLGRLAARFPLRRIDPDGFARPIQAEAVPLRGETTLCLSRGQPR